MAGIFQNGCKYCRAKKTKPHRSEMKSSKNKWTMVTVLRPSKGSSKKSRKYARDLKNRLLGQLLGGKVLAESLRLNLLPGQDAAREIDTAGKFVQEGRNTFLKIMMSFDTGIILSPRQVDYAVDRYLHHLSVAAYVTAPSAPGEKVAKSQRQQRRDLRDQIAEFTAHDNTDNLHLHGDLSMVDKFTGQVIVINNGYWKYGSEYARQETLIDLGMLPVNEPARYLMREINGLNRVEDTLESQTVNDGQDPEKTAAEIMQEVLEVDLVKPLNFLPATAAQFHRGRPHPGEAFHKMVADAYPEGPPPPLPPIPATENFTDPAHIRALKERLVSAEKARADFGALLIKNNMSIKTGGKSGLVLSAHGEHVAMLKATKAFDQRWTRKAIEGFTWLSGKWELGLPAEKQEITQDHKSSVEYLRERLLLGREKHAGWFEKSLSPHALPWPDYSVEVRQLNGQTQRPGRMPLAELKSVADDYINNACEGTVAKTTATAKSGNVPACTMTIRPCMRDGEMLLAIHDIPEVCIEEFKKRFDPALLLRTEMGHYTAVMLLHYDQSQRWQARNARARVGNDIVSELGAKNWTDGFLMPEAPGLQEKGWVFPRIMRAPHRKVSEVAQKTLGDAWQKLVVEEHAWWSKVAEIAEQRQGLPPGAITTKLENTLHREPLRRGGPLAQNTAEPSLDRVQAIEMARVLAPGTGDGSSKNDRHEEDEAKQKKSTPQLQNSAPLIRVDDEEEAKEKKRKLQEKLEQEQQEQGLIR
jgi:hypothetical protein